MPAPCSRSTSGASRSAGRPPVEANTERPSTVSSMANSADAGTPALPRLAASEGDWGAGTGRGSRARPLRFLRMQERLVEVAGQILRILEPDGKPDQILADA